MNASPLIACREAQPCYGGMDHPIPSLSCTIEAASVTCLIGAYRRDVSRYLRVLGGVDPHCGGEVAFFGESDTALDTEHRRLLHTRIGFVSSATPLLSILNGIDNVKLPAQYHHSAPAEEIEQRAAALIDAIEYEADHTVLPAYMTHLQRRHLTIARALIMNPQVLCIEAPFVDVDHFSIALLQNFLLQQVEAGVALLMGSDNLCFVREHADQILFIGRRSTHTFNEYAGFLASTDSEIRDYIARKRQTRQVLE